MQNYIGKRVLIRHIQRTHLGSVSEVLVLEVSVKALFVKVKNEISGSLYWLNICEYEVIDELTEKL